VPGITRMCNYQQQWPMERVVGMLYHLRTRDNYPGTPVSVLQSHGRVVHKGQCGEEKLLQRTLPSVEQLVGLFKEMRFGHECADDGTNVSENW